MRAKLLQHPTAALRNQARARSTTPAEPLADSGLPYWFYWLAVAGTATVLLFGAPYNLPVLAVCWVVYLYFVFSSPERAIFAFLLTMALLRLSPVRGIPLLPGMNSDTLFVVTLGLCAVASRTRQPQPPGPNAYIRPIVFVSIVLTVSAILSFGTGAGQSHSIARGWYPYSGGAMFSSLKSDLFYLFLAPIAFRLLWNRKQLVASVAMVAIYGVTAALDALMGRSAEALDIVGRAPRFLRASGAMFNEPNNLGGFLAILAVSLAPVVLSRSLGYRGTLLLGGSLAVMLSGLIYSFSRGAWVAALGGFLLLALLRGARGLAIVVILVLSATAWMPQAVIDRYEHTVREAELPGASDTEFDSSTESRVARWKAVPGMFLDSPLYGHGYEAFPKTYGVLNQAGRETGPHSTITKLLIEEGLFGIVAYIWIVCVMFFTAFRLRKITDDAFVEALATGVCAAVPTLVILDLTGNRLLNDVLMGPMWLLFAGVTRQYYNLRYAPTKEPAAVRS